MTSDNGIVGFVLYDISIGWRNAVMVWDIAAPDWLLTLAFGCWLSTGAPGESARSQTRT